MEHAHHEGMMHGDSGAAMGGMSGGMPVAFDWGTRVTLFFHSWATETTLDYLVALIGVFLLCVAQEHLFYQDLPATRRRSARARRGPLRAHLARRTSAPRLVSPRGVLRPPFAVFDRRGCPCALGCLWLLPFL